MKKFEITPKQINSTIRKSNLILIENIISRIENEAIQILIKANICDESYYSPPFPSEPETWRRFWLNEALHQCENFDPVGDAGVHLEQAERAAVNVLVSASALRDALENEKTEEAAALAMILVSDVVIGGLSIELKDTTEKHISSKRMPYQSGIGKQKADFDRMRKVVINFAITGWKNDPSVLIGKMASEALDDASINFSEYKTLNNYPKEKTILGWLRSAAKSGELEIPPGARMAGRPRKSAA